MNLDEEIRDFEDWFRKRREETWRKSGHGTTNPSANWSMGLRPYLLEGWLARAAEQQKDQP